MEIMKLLFAIVGIYLITSPAQGLEKAKRWEKYIDNMERALRALKPCIKNACTCHKDQMDRDFEPFKNGIRKDDFDNAKKYGTLYKIFNRRLYRQEKCSYPGRCHGVEYFLNQTKDNLPDMEFVINLRDYPQSFIHAHPKPIFSFSKGSEHWDILFPAWSFWDGGPTVMPIYPTGLGRWDLHLESIPEAAKKSPWASRKNQAFFWGSRTSEERDAIIMMSRGEPHLANASYTKNQAFQDRNDTLGAEPAEPVRFEDHCQYKYLFNFRGVTSSFRFRHLFLCASLVFHVDNEWTEFFYSSLKPWVHYVPVEADFSNAKDLLEFFTEHEHYAREIAMRGRHRVMDHLKMEDVRCYWEKLLRKYASFTTWKPQWEDSLIEIGGEIPHDEL